MDKSKVKLSWRDIVCTVRFICSYRDNDGNRCPLVKKHSGVLLLGHETPHFFKASPHVPAFFRVTLGVHTVPAAGHKTLGAVYNVYILVVTVLGVNKEEC